jgi:hypothetical protein
LSPSEIQSEHIDGAHRHDQMRDRDDNDAADEEGKGERHCLCMLKTPKVEKI